MSESAKENQGKPENGVPAKIIFHILCFYNSICHNAVTFQTGMHFIWITAWFSFCISTGRTEIQDSVERI